MSESTATDLFLPTAAADCRPLWLVTEGGLEGWLASQPAAAAAWVRANGFQGERHRLLLLAGQGGELAGAVYGLGSLPSADELGVWHVAGLPGKLAQGRWSLATPLAPASATRAALGWAMGCYRFDRLRRTPANQRQASLATPEGADMAYVRRAAAADAFARDLVNTPAGDLGPAELAAAAEAVAARHGAKFRQVVGDELLRERLPAIHAVGRAGPQAPRLIDLSWGHERHPRLTLVGKGVCFDTGGLDLKPSTGMALMKKDMGGSAMALAIAAMVMDAGLPVRLRVLIPAVENSVAGNAYRPGDVVRTRKGLSIEVGNTDAEGRIVLADALTLAGEDEPELLIDLATLTGAARVALGPELPALFTPDAAMAADLQRLGTQESDPLWWMPLWDGYDEDLSSKVGDLNNVAPHAFAGAILGALFLRRFVANPARWMHVDLYAWNPKDRPGRPVGAEAQCIRAMFAMLAARYPA